jgi:hypothetical protein
MTYLKEDGELIHRMVVELFIGRKLKPEEVVHHINLNKFGWNQTVRRKIAFRWKGYK